MPPSRLGSVVRVALSLGLAEQCSDTELLTRFVEGRDHTAFEALIARHTPGVRAACRGWLRSPADIDDAAQATFLVLVRRAGSIRERAALGGWLYRVADNVARRLRSSMRQALPLPHDLPGHQEPDDSEEAERLAAEVARLPEKYRVPVQLCYLAGLTAAEAADRLGWPRGTVLTRLSRARDRLKKSLAGRVGELPTAALPVPGGALLAGRPWAEATARAGLSLLTGGSPNLAGASPRCLSLTEGVVREMVWSKMKYVVAGAILALSGIGFGLHHWANASDRPAGGSGEHQPARAAANSSAPGGARAEKDEKRPAEAQPGRRREAVIRVPTGAFVKDVEAAPYGSGRIQWTYEEDRVLGHIEASVMGFEVELATEAEYSLSSNGTIYGVLTSVTLKQVRLPADGKLGELKPYLAFWSLIEPMFTEMATDLPFSYRFRVHGDRLVISNFRMLLAGPNPLGKLGGVFNDTANRDTGGPLLVLNVFQALGTAVEGTYAVSDGNDKAAPGRPRAPAKPTNASKFPSFKR